jgi:tetratricopeptide (TPR) repeat protein
VKIVVLVVITLLESIAFAQPTQPTAEDLYGQGEEAFNRRDYATAIAKWQTSYDLSHEPLLLFNLGHAYRLSGDCPRALATYRKFAADDPTADEYALAIKLSQEMEAKCGSPSPAPAPIVTAPSPTESSEVKPIARDERSDHPGRALKITGLAIGGVGLVTFTTGLYLSHHGQVIGDEITSACRTSCDWASWKERDAQGRKYAAIGRGLAIGGSVAALGGVALYYLGMRERSITIEPRAQGGAMVSWGAKW